MLRELGKGVLVGLEQCRALDFVVLVDVVLPQLLIETVPVEVSEHSSFHRGFGAWRPNVSAHVLLEEKRHLILGVFMVTVFRFFHYGRCGFRGRSSIHRLSQ